MAGIKWHTWMLVAGLTVFATIACTPSLRWIVQNHVDMTVGRTNLLRNGLFFKRGPEILGTSASDTKRGDKRLDIARALLSPNWEDRPRLLAPLAERYRDDAFLQAALVRYCLTLDLSPWPPSHPLTPWQIWALTAAVQAAKRGEHIEPNNAYFPLASAVFHLHLGDIPSTLKAVDRASRASQYVDYVLGDGDLLAGLVRARDYRGEDAIGILYVDMTGHVSSFMWLARRLPILVHGKESLRVRMQLLKAFDTISRNSDQLIGMLVSYSSARILVREPGTRLPMRDRYPSASVQSSQNRTNRQYLEDCALASSLQQKARSAGVAVHGIDAPGIMRTLESNREACFWFPYPDLTDLPAIPGIDVSVGLLWGLLIGLAACVLVIAGQSLKASHEWLSEAMPFAAPLGLCFFLGQTGDLRLVAGLLLLLVASIMIHRPSTRTAGWCALVACGIGSLASLGVLSHRLLPAGWLIILLPLSMIRFRGNAGYLAALILVLIVSGASVALIAANLRPADPGGPATAAQSLAPAAAIFGLAFVLAPRSKASISALAGPFVLAMAVAYALSVGYELRWNERLKPMIAQWAHAGPIIREHARRQSTGQTVHP